MSVEWRRSVTVASPGVEWQLCQECAGERCHLPGSVVAATAATVAQTPDVAHSTIYNRAFK